MNRKDTRPSAGTEEPRLLRKLALARYLGVSTKWLDRQVAAGQFPKPIHLSRVTVVWRREDIEAWLAAKAAARDAAA
ncbi:putative DNA-binding transcriptional regulator AlpA [Angulomicrobium tetraedrale]|uniref:Putative DNA-binding transcriptional regulator AlpA n=2 Tax=Ancylobacter tetraedralis TaxID=217068 RepID=A0A839ZBG6_9HYPH|nr:putative DNA-binding transcriptional regulator AlpA [Ancylobacter tetraedralis]